MPPTILLADDDRALRKLIRAYLVEEGLAVHEAADGEEALQLARRLAPDLIVLDVNMPRCDGFEVLRRLGDDAPPVMMLTARADEVDQLVGYRLGLVDYVVKPVSPKIMAAKVKALLARARPAAVVRKPIELGPLRIDVPARAVTCDGRPVDLTRRELDVLLALAEHPGWVYTRDQLLSHVWGYDAVAETRLVDMQVANLRRKLGPAAALVETVRGVGYRLQTPA
jgi:DNA-binding response OmpR family regulator